VQIKYEMKYLLIYLSPMDKSINISIFLSEPPVIRYHHHQLLGSLSGAGRRAGFNRDEENRAPAKEQ